MKIIKLASTALPLPVTVDGESFIIHRANVPRQSNEPQQFVLAARPPKKGEAVEDGDLKLKIELSELFRTPLQFDDAVKNGFQVEDSFIDDRTAAKRILEALCKQGHAAIIVQKK